MKIGEESFRWREGHTRAAVWFIIALYAVVIVRSAWLMDDAFITFRTVDNFIHGLGLTWNPVERVQAYTNPLWMFLVSALFFVTREIFYTPLYLSIALSIVAVVLVARRVAITPTMALLGILALVHSKAFVDYSTSGLENPLSHFMIALFSVSYLRAHDEQQILPLAVIVSLGAVNRMDTVLLFLPGLVCVAGSLTRRKILWPLAIGFLPFVLWELFSLFYYGFLFPNTAYVKLNTGLPRVELVGQGLKYLLHSVTLDPLTPLTIAAALYLPIAGKEGRQIPLSIGVALYVAYVVWIGGDFMSGRFLSAPLFASVALLVSRDRLGTFWKQLLAAVAVLGIGLSSLFPPLLSGSDYGRQGVASANGIADERAAYFQSAGLLPAWSADYGVTFPNHAWAEGARAVRPGPSQFGAAVWANVGFTAYFAGPNMHVIDPIGLGDPLLARLPPIDDPDWGIGHQRRVIPEGYYETVLYGKNQIVDDSLAVYFEKLRTVTRGDLFDTQRLREIWRLNTGEYDHLVDHGTYRRPPPLYRRISDAYEQPQNPSIQLALAAEQFRSGRIEKGMAALKRSLQLKRTSLLEYMEKRGFARSDWAGFLRKHLATVSHGKEPVLEEFEIFVHYTWIYAALREARRRTNAHDSSAAATLRLEAVVHARAVLDIQEDGSIYHLLGTGLQRDGQLEEAAIAFRRSIVHTHDKSYQYQSYRDLADVLSHMGDDAGSEEATAIAVGIAAQMAGKDNKPLGVSI